MRAGYIPGIDLKKLLDPDAEPWQKARPERVRLMGTPLGLQPTDAIRANWATKPIGAVEQVAVTALHDGRMLAFRLEWGDPSENRTIEDTTQFPDSASIVMPSQAAAPLVTMGAPGAAVNAWYWRADDEDGPGRHVVAEGIGTSRTLDRELVQSRGLWKGGRWRVVIARALRVETNEPVAQLRAGEKTSFGVAVWEGSQAERAGIKAFSGDWRELELEAAHTVRR